MVVLNRIDQADPAMVRRWAAWFKSQGMAVLETDCKSRKGVGGFVPAIRAMLSEKLQRYQEKGQVGRPLKIMVAGIPNVGKSTFINQIAGRKSAKAENRPGVTRGKQWITVDQGLLLLDTPGILWPKFEDQQVGMKLAFIGSIKDEILNTEELAAEFLKFMQQHYPGIIAGKYNIEETGDVYEVLNRIAESRHCIVRGNELDVEKAAALLMDDFRSGRLGELTLEYPDRI